ncbi:SCO family protein [Sphingomonas sp. HF-S4]|uniref:SCO family protein n=1 Tax=Sphingomonas agrestis TaxID=3080540 RepID=A0ABU3YB13_9SPHN|nr:SCO family protein [Sphingomonas sp. HF-S4]MDV3458580.1 SCO family protein [Sphingomonas sp. HF-S4]
MAERAMYRLFPALALLLPLAACGTGTTGEPPLAGARIGGTFALTDQNGKTVRDTDFAGKYRIVYFGYTYCPDVCPTDMAKIAQAMRQLDKEAPRTAAKVVPIFITVDPERDTPAAIRQFVANFYPRTVGLTGSPKAIADVAKSYAVYYKKQPPGPGGGYMVDHLAVAFLMGPKGEPIASLPIDQEGAAIAEQVRHWVR